MPIYKMIVELSVITVIVATFGFAFLELLSYFLK